MLYYNLCHCEFIGRMSIVTAGSNGQAAAAAGMPELGNDAARLKTEIFA